jgi:hypothetical protein
MSGFNGCSVFAQSLTSEYFRMQQIRVKSVIIQYRRFLFMLALTRISPPLRPYYREAEYNCFVFIL